MPNSHIFFPNHDEPISDEKLEHLDKFFTLPIEEAETLTHDELYEDPDLGLE